MSRINKCLPTKNEFLILTNGKCTEINYFKGLRSCYKSIFDIHIRFTNADPPALVEYAIKQKSEKNRVWCVFDKDDFPKESIIKAFQSAKKYNIGIAFSNAAFELWLINHFTKFERESTANELLKEIDKILKNNCNMEGYSKNDYKCLKDLFMPLLDYAVQNARILKEKKIREYLNAEHSEENFPVWDWNPYTDIYELIKALKLTNKE